MPVGPGKYDDLLTTARDAAKAIGGVLVIVGGEHGTGFSVQGPLPLLLTLPTVLRQMADEIERSTTSGRA